MVPRECSVVRIGRRPAGFSVSRLTSISPHWVSSKVRGIGVAVMISTSVCSPLAPRVRRWVTPNRCCSSITASARSRYSTASWNSAWVPTTIWIDPSLMPRSSRARSLPLIEPVSSATGSGTKPASACGSAAWPAPRSAPSARPACPASTARSIASSATSVLPDPTSPCSSRSIRRGEARSASISGSACTCEAVGGKPNRCMATSRSLRIADQRLAGPRPHPPADQRLRDLSGEQFVIGQPRAHRGGRAAPSGRRLHGAQSFGERRPFLPLQQRRIMPLREFRQQLQRLRQPGGDLARPQTRRSAARPARSPGSARTARPAPDVPDARSSAGR